MHINDSFHAVSVLKVGKMNRDQASITETLGTGKRINRAGDDPGNTAIAERLTKQINGMRQGARNSSDAIAMVNVFEQALTSVMDILYRAKELGLQSANGTFAPEDRLNMDTELQSILEEIDRISASTAFNGNTFFANGNSSVTILLSENADDTMDIQFRQMDTATLFGGGISVATVAEANDMFAKIDQALNDVINYRTDLGAYSTRLEHHIDDLNNTAVNLADARSRLEDTDMASAVSELAKKEIIASASMQTLSKAFQRAQQIVRLF